MRDTFKRNLFANFISYNWFNNIYKFQDLAIT